MGAEPVKPQNDEQVENQINTDLSYESDSDSDLSDGENYWKNWDINPNTSPPGNRSLTKSARKRGTSKPVE